MVSEHASPLAVLGGEDAGGQNVHVAALSIELGRLGHEVDIYTRRDDPTLPPVVRLADGVRVVHVDAGPPGSPKLADMIANVKNGVMIDGRGSYSIDQQRYNGQFGGHVFWEIKNGKITRPCTDVTYNAITTDFWGNLEGITGPKEWQARIAGIPVVVEA